MAMALAQVPVNNLDVVIMNCIVSQSFIKAMHFAVLIHNTFDIVFDNLACLVSKRTSHFQAIFPTSPGDESVASLIRPRLRWSVGGGHSTCSQ